MLALVLLALAMPGQFNRPYFRPSPPAVPASQLSPDFPVHLRVIESRWYYDYGSYTGFGRADILGTGGLGLDFNYTCDQPFRFNELHGEFYQGRWKKQDTQLELLLQRVGSDHLMTCKLKTTLKDAAYSPQSATWTEPIKKAPAAAAPGAAPDRPTLVRPVPAQPDASPAPGATPPPSGAPAPQ